MTRRTLIAVVTGLALALTAGTMQSAFAQMPTFPDPEPGLVIPYGPGELQYGELRLPEGDGPFPVAVTIHGGCFLDRLGQGTLRGASAALAEAGFAAWDVNYRRLGHEGGGWPGSYLDVGSAIDHLRKLAGEYPLDLDRVVVIGHSAGAPLAVWAAGRSALPQESEIRGASPLRVKAAVALDGPMDLAAWSRTGRDAAACGGEATIERFMGGTPDEVPDHYRTGSPAQMPPNRSAIYLLNAGMMIELGDSERMTRRVESGDEDITVIPVPESDHFQLVIPDEPTWSVVLETIITAARTEPGAIRTWLEEHRGTDWSGPAELWLDPTGYEALNSDATLTVEGDALTYTWAYEGEEQQGELRWDEQGVSWHDSWHQGEAVELVPIPSHGSLFAGAYSYPAGTGPDWHWRIKLSQRPDDALVLQMTNVAPWGEEARAVRMVFSSAGDAP